MNVWRLITHHIDPGRALTWTLQNGRIAIGWGKIGDLRQQRCQSSKDIGVLIRHHYPEIHNSGSGGMSLWNFFHEMRKGDLVILSGNKPRERVVEVQGDYEFHLETPALDAAGLVGEYQHQRKVNLTALDAEALWREAGGGPASGQSIRITLMRCTLPLDISITTSPNIPPPPTPPASAPPTPPASAPPSPPPPAALSLPAQPSIPATPRPPALLIPVPLPDASGQSGRDNTLTRQIGEFLVCAELGRRGYLATPFSGNVPAFNVLATDELCRTVPIQVQASNHDNWPARAQDWMEIDFDPETGTQHLRGPVEIINPDLIYVCVSIAPVGSRRHDRFFVLTKRDVQMACINGYTDWMEKNSGKQSRHSAGFNCRYFLSAIEEYEDNWALVAQRMRDTSHGRSLDAPHET